jgi:hypothetical protein
MKPGAVITGPLKHAKKTKAKGRKIGRNKARAALYALRHSFEMNKCRKLRRVLLRNPNDVNALASLLFNAQALSKTNVKALDLERFGA